MEDKLFYFQDTNTQLWKNVKNNIITEDTNWSFQGTTGGQSGTLQLPSRITKIYVTLLGGGGSGSLGERRPLGNSMRLAHQNNNYNEYTNMVPLGGCGGGGGATVFRLPIILLQTNTTYVDYSVARGGEGTTNSKNDPMPTAAQRLGKNGEDSTIIVRQINSSGVETRRVKVKAMGGGGGGTVGHFVTRKNIYDMNPADVKYNWAWSWGPEIYVDEGIDDMNGYLPNDYMYWSVRKSDNPNDPDYYYTEHFHRLAEHYTKVFSRPAFVFIAIHTEESYPLGSNNPIYSAEHRNEYIPYNFLTHGKSGILNKTILEPKDSITLNGLGTKRMGGNVDKYYKAVTGSSATSEFTSSAADINNIDNNSLLRFKMEPATPTFFNLFYSYGKRMFIDDRPSIQIWSYDIERISPTHPTYCINYGRKYFYKDRTIIYPKDTELPTDYPGRDKLTIVENGNDYVLDKWTPEFRAMMTQGKGPLVDTPQEKGNQGAFGGAGGGFIDFDDITPQSLSGLYGGVGITNKWRLPASGKGGNPYPRKVYKILSDISGSSTSNQNMDLYYWGGEGYEDANSNGEDVYISTYFIPGSGGGSVEYHHQNRLLSKRQYIGSTVTFNEGNYPEKNESTALTFDNRIFKWFTNNYEKICIGGKIKHRLRTENQPITKLYIDDNYGKHKIYFQNKGETGPRPIDDLLMIYDAGGGGGKAFRFNPGNGQESPDTIPLPPGPGCGSGGSCSLNEDGEAVITGTPLGSVDYYLRRILLYSEGDMYTSFKDESFAAVIGSFIAVMVALIVISIAITIATQGISAKFSAIMKTVKSAIKSGESVNKVLLFIYKAQKKIRYALSWIRYKLNWLVSTEKYASVKEMKKALKLAAKADELAQAAKLKKMWNSGKLGKLKFYAQQIPGQLFSLLTGDIGDVFYDSFNYVDDIGKIANKIDDFFGFAQKLKKIAKTIDTVSEIGRKTSRIVDFTNATESAAKLGETVGDGVKTALNTSEALVKPANASDDVLDTWIDSRIKFDNLEDLLYGKNQSEFFNGTFKSDLFEQANNNNIFKQIESSNFSLEDQKKLLTKLDAKIKSASPYKSIDVSPKLKLEGGVDIPDNPYLSKVNHVNNDFMGFGTYMGSQTRVKNSAEWNDFYKAFQNNMKDSLSKLDNQITLLKNANTVVDPLTLSSVLSNPKLMTQLDSVQKNNILNALAKNLENVDLAKSSQMATDLIKHFEGLLQAKEINLDDFIGMMGKIFKNLDQNSPIKSLAVFSDLSKYTSDPALLKNFSKTDDLRQVFLKSSLNSNGVDSIYQYINQNPKFQSSLINMIDAGYFKNLNMNNIAKSVNNAEYTKMMDNLAKSDDFKNIIAKDPTKLDSMSKLLDEVDVNTFNKAKLNVYNEMSKNEKLLPYMMKNITPDNLKSMKSTLDSNTVGGLSDQEFVQNISKYLDTKIREGNYNAVYDGAKMKINVDGEDVTDMLNEMNAIKKIDVNKKITNNVPLNNADINGSFGNSAKLKQVGLNDLNERYIKELNLADSTSATRADLLDAGNKQAFTDSILAKKNSLISQKNAKINELQGKIDELNGYIDYITKNSDKPQEIATVTNNSQSSISELNKNISAIQKTFDEDIAKCDSILNQLDEITPEYRYETVENSVELGKMYSRRYKDFEDHGVNINKEIIDDLNNVDTFSNLKLNGAINSVDSNRALTNSEIDQLQRQIDSILAENDKIKLRNADARAKYEIEMDKNKEILDKLNKEKEIISKYEAELKSIQDSLSNDPKLSRKNLDQFEKDIMTRYHNQKLDTKDLKFKDKSLYVKNKQTGRYNLDKTGNPTLDKVVGIQNNTLVDGATKRGKILNPLTRKMEGAQTVILMKNTPYENVKDYYDSLDRLKNLTNKQNSLIDLINNTRTTFPTINQLKLENLKSVDDLLKRMDFLKQKKIFLNTVAEELRNIPISYGKQIKVNKIPLPIVPKSNSAPIPKNIIIDIIEPTVKIDMNTVSLDDVKLLIDNDDVVVKLAGDDIINVIDEAPAYSRKISREIVEYVPLDYHLDWLKYIRAIIKVSYRTVYIINQIYNTDRMSEIFDLKDNINSPINTKIILGTTMKEYNFIDTCVSDILDRRPSQITSQRIRIYEDIFGEVFGKIIKIERNQIDNKMIEMLYEQKRRGLFIDKEYVKANINYQLLNIFNQSKYNYIIEDFNAIKISWTSQLQKIKKNYKPLY